MKKVSWITLAILSILTGLYPVIYFLIDRKFGLLSSKSIQLLNDNLWNSAFYMHIIFGGLALLIGWLQFSNKLRVNRKDLHRAIGKMYMFSVFISGFSGLYVALFATGGLISVLGFFTLGLVWLVTTFLGLRTIKKGNINLHEKFMIFSYASCFAAVTLRLWLPLLSIGFGDFMTAYKIVSWLCWVPNIIVAYFIIRNKRFI
jgi:uncharacterized membrane protein